MKNRNNGSRIFLTELMFSILFFIIIAAVCVQCFAQSYVMSREAKETSEAVNVASNAAENFLADKGADSFTYYFDEDWKQVEEDGCYRETGLITEDEQLRSMNIIVSRVEDETEIYTLNVEKAR